MSLAEKRVYLEAIRRRYRLASRAKKSIILDEFCAVCVYNRKYAIRILSKRRHKKRAKPGRKPWYDPKTLIEPLKAIWTMCFVVNFMRLARPLSTDCSNHYGLNIRAKVFAEQSQFVY